MGSGLLQKSKARISVKKAMIQYKTYPMLKGVHLPFQANYGDLGADVYAADEPEIVGIPSEDRQGWESISFIEYDTGLIVEQEDLNYGLFVFPRSSISKYNLILANHVGVIDPSYRDTIKLRFRYILQPCDLVIEPGIMPYVKIDEDKIYQRGDKIGQLYPAKRCDFEFKQVSSLDEINMDTERGRGGFGSTGK